MQYYEYCILSVFIDHSIVSSSLYLISGLHDIHVVVGIVLLFIGTLKILLYYFCVKNSIGFVISIYSWHFVDIIWILVYLTQYVFIAHISLDWILNFIYLDAVNDETTQFLPKLVRQIKTIDDIIDSDIAWTREAMQAAFKWIESQPLKKSLDNVIK